MAEIQKYLSNEPSKLEAKIIKAILKREDAILDVMDIIDENCFTVNEFSSIYRAMLQLYKDDQGITPENIQVWAEQNNIQIESNLIQKLYHESYTSLKISKTAEIIKELYQRRVSLQSIRKLLDDQESNPTNFNELLEKINDIAMESNELVSSSTGNTKCFSDKDAIITTIKERLLKNEDDMGIKVNIPVIDNELRGIKPKLYVMCADAQIGKSQFAIQLCVNAVKNNPDAIIDFYELEMSKQETEERMLSCLTGISSQYINNPKSYFNYFDEERCVYGNKYHENPNSKEVKEFFDTLQNGIDTLNKSNIYVDDTPDLNTYDILARVNKNALKRGNPSIVVIDHINIACSGNVSEEVSLLKDAYNQLKKLSKKLNCAVIVLHQFSKENLAKDDKHMGNIFGLYGGSGARMYADVIMTLYRADVYRDVIEKYPEMKGYAHISFDKVRYCKKPDTTRVNYTGYSFEQIDSSVNQGNTTNGYIDIGVLNE